MRDLCPLTVPKKVLSSYMHSVDPVPTDSIFGPFLLMAGRPLHQNKYLRWDLRDSLVFKNALLIGSSGRIRTYNPPVNSRMLYR